MTLQQLEYIIALEEYGSFVAASDALNINQSTLSITVKKLEEELDVRIFNRDKHPIDATEIGRRIIDEARLVLYHSNQIAEMTKSEKELSTGDLRIGCISTVAPVLIPGMFKFIMNNYSGIQLQMEEMLSSTVRNSLKKAEIDMGIVMSQSDDDEIMEIPLYTEKFLAYVSPKCDAYRLQSVEYNSFLDYPLWIMKNGVRRFDESLLLPGEKFRYENMYEGGRVGTLIKIVNENGGMTIVPETHLGLIMYSHHPNIRQIVNPEPSRTIYLIIRKDYIHEKRVNIVLEAIKSVIPQQLLSQYMRVGYIKL